MNPAFDDSYLDALHRHDPIVEDHLVRCFSKALKAPLRRRCSGPQAVEDVAQETLFRVLSYFRSGKTLRAASNLPAFVNSISSNVSRELWRAESRSEPLDEAFGGSSDQHDNPEAAAIAQQQARRVRQTLQRLPPKDQQVLQSVFLEESDKDQVCQDLQTNREHLRVLVYRARQRFRALTERDDHQPGTPAKEATAPNRSDLTREHVTN